MALLAVLSQSLVFRAKSKNLDHKFNDLQDSKFIKNKLCDRTADGAYDGAPTYQTIAAYGEGIKVVIPPRSTAVPGGDPGLPTQRDRHLAMIAEQGRWSW